MKEKEVREIYRWRKTIVNNIDSILKKFKKSKENKEKNAGQMSLFDSVEEEIEIDTNIEEYDGYINMNECFLKEKELLGISVLYDPIKEAQMYKDLYCTHEAEDILKMNKNINGIIIIDIVTKVEETISQRGNRYAKVYISQLGSTYMFLFTNEYRKFISSIIVGDVHLIELNYSIPTVKFDRESISISRIKSLKYVDIEEKYNQVISNAKVTKLDEPWMLKNLKIMEVKFSEIKPGDPFRYIDEKSYADFVKKGDNGAYCLISRLYPLFEKGKIFEDFFKPDTIVIDLVKLKKDEQNKKSKNEGGNQ